MPYRLAVRLVLILSLGAAAAQTIHCVPPKDCTTAVQFLPTQAQYAAAVGGTLAPTSPTTPIGFQVLQDHQLAYTVQTSRAPWAPATPLALQARITLSGPHVATRVIGWMPVTSVPTTLFTEDANKTDVSVEYRLAITGREPPGTYTTTVTYTVRSEGGKGSNGKGRDTVTNTISVTIPAYLTLLLDGVPVGQTASVSFDYRAANLSAYLQAVSSGTPLAFTSASFDRLEIATNDPAGYRVSVSVTEDAAPAGSSLGVSDVLLFSKPANGYAFTSGAATDGYQTLLVPSDFGIHVDGGETAGAYQFTVTYRAQANP